jgi:hypothetical protein
MAVQLRAEVGNLNESGCFLGALTMASPMFCMLLRAMWKEHVGLHFSAGCDYW